MKRNYDVVDSSKQPVDNSKRIKDYVDSNYIIKRDKDYTRKITAYQQPTEVSHFSYDGKRNLKWDRSSLGYFAEPDLTTTLSTGFDSFLKRDESVNEHLDSLLKSIDRIEPPPKVDFVMWRVYPGGLT
jgi:hypothetical protein